MLYGCQGAEKLRTPTWEEKKCPQCGHMIEIFPVMLRWPVKTAGLSSIMTSSPVSNGVLRQKNAWVKKCTTG